MNKNVLLLFLIFIIGLTSQVTFAITVSSCNDSGTSSLRQAISDASSNDTINFDKDCTINLNSQLLVNKNLTIDGLGYTITISGQNTYRIFQIENNFDVTINNLMLTQGKGEYGGGIQNNGTLTLNNVTFSLNSDTSSLGGGGLYNNGEATVNNSTFSNNQSLTGNGGGIFNNLNQTLIIKNSTLFGNSALQGGGLYNEGTLQLTNTIIANSSGGDCENIGSITTNTNNLITDGSCIPNFTDDPQLGPLQNNGGFTETFALLNGSPAIGKGDPSTCLGTDQRGKTRDSPCDIGAFEFNNAPVADNVTFTTIINTKLSDTLPATDADGDNLTYSIVLSSSLGTVNITNSTTGAFTYTPPLNQTGTDTFTYKVEDDDPFNPKASAVATVTIKIVNNVVVDNNLSDTDDGNTNPGENTLREAIKNALPGDMITFANFLAGQMITLDKNNGPLVINKNLIIDGTGQNITLSGDSKIRLFQINGVVNVTINHLTLISGKSEDGGAIQVNNGASLSLNDCTIFDNQNTGNSHRGGALFIDTSAKVEINRCLIDSNKSSGNPGQGGGIFNQGQLTLNNSTIINNEANKGGGGLYNQTSAEINNSTFSANLTAQQDQGSNLNNAGTLKLTNTILANSDQNGKDCTNTSNITEHHNIIELDNNCKSSITSLTDAPQLGTLQDNGGSTKTLALLAGSPAIDAGDNVTCLKTDQRGESRPIDGNNDSSAICDIGAFEFEIQSGISQQDSEEPSVVSTAPLNNATEVSTTVVVTINFNEKVEATTNSFSLKCPAGTAITFNLSASPATSFTLTPVSDLPFGTQCQVQVLASQITDFDTLDPPDNLSSDYSFSFQTLPSPPTIPSPPTNLQALPDSATQIIELSWNDNSNNETGFKITRDGHLLSTTAVDTTTYQDNSLNCGTNYSYSVTAFNTAGESTAATIMVKTWDCPISPPPPPSDPPGSTDNTTTQPPPVTTPDPLGSTDNTTTQPPPVTTPDSLGSTDNTTPPPAPVELKVVAVSPTEITLTWNDTSDNETGFKIERNDILIHITAADVTTYKDTELTCNTTYNYTVRATNASGDSTTLTTSITMPTCVTTPIVPSNLKIIATSPTEVNLSWTDNSNNETGFKIERDGTVVHITLANVTHYQDSGLTCGTNYRYQVTATNAIGDSPVLTQTITTLACTSMGSLPASISLGISFAGNGEGQVKNSAAEILCDSSDKDICIHYFKVLTPVTLVATAAEGSQFLFWEGDCQNISDSIEFILSSERHCIAHFDKVAHIPPDNANNISDSKDPELCQLDKSINCNELPIVNHPPMDMTLSNQFIDENSPGGTFIGKLTTLDSEVNEAHQYTLLNDANHTFTLQSDELYLAQPAQLDFETISSYTINVRSTNNHGAFIDKTFTIKVNDNYESQFLGKVLTADWRVGKNLTIDAPETVNIIGYIKPQLTHIGQIADIIATYDWTPAQENQTELNVPITIAHQTPLQADMQLSLYEGRLIGLAGIFKITLGYQLNNGESLAGQIITLNVSPNRSPTDIYLSNHTVMENSQPNTVIGEFATTDPDRQEQFTYGLIDNPGNYFTIIGNELRVNQFHFNYANSATYPIKVRSVDMSGAYVEKNFTIEIIDTQSKLKDIQLTKTTVLENSPNGFIIGRLWNQDDELGHYQYELIDDAQGRFTLMNDLILIANQDEFDFESQSSYRITVRGWQTDTQQILEKTFIINILNVVDVTVRGKLYDFTYQPIDSSHLRSADEVTVELQIIPDQIHRGQVGELLSVALWVANSGETVTYMLNGDTWEEWDGDLATLRSVQTLTLQDHHELTLWQGKLPHFSLGQFYIFGGYYLNNGEIVYSPQPFEVPIQ